MSVWYGGNRFLSREEMTANAKYIYGYLKPRGWSINAICAMLGNMETESTINPSIWQNLDAGNLSLGYGLVQWTPATKFIEWCAVNSLGIEHINSALARIEWEVANGEQWIKTDEFPFSFNDFKVSSADISTLANAFLRNYERPAEQTQPARAAQALAWYEVLKGESGSLDDGSGTGTQTPTKRNKVPLWLLISATRQKR